MFSDMDHPRRSVVDAIQQISHARGPAFHVCIHWRINVQCFAVSAEPLQSYGAASNDVTT